MSRLVSSAKPGSPVLSGSGDGGSKKCLLSRKSAGEQTNALPGQEAYLRMPGSLHVLDRIGVSFDDDHAVANAGLVLPATLLVHLGLSRRRQRRVDGVTGGSQGGHRGARHPRWRGVHR